MQLLYLTGRAFAFGRAALPALLRDGAGLAGACLIARGAAMIYEPAGYIAGGALLLLGAFLAGRNAG